MSSNAASISQDADILESRQAAIKTRIITHMNADHSFSLQIYLRHFCAVPQNLVTDAKLTDITTEYMIIESEAGRTIIPFEPPMKSLTEARERTVSMHHEALSALGLSSIVINTFALPNKLWQMFTNAIVIFCLVTMPFRSQILPSSGSMISKLWSIGGLFPGLAKLTYALSPYALVFIYSIHSLEAIYFERSRLRKHQVSAGSPVWYLWVAHAFVGGIACFNRFDALVKEKEDDMKKRGNH